MPKTLVFIGFVICIVTYLVLIDGQRRRSNIDAMQTPLSPWSGAIANDGRTHKALNHNRYEEKKDKDHGQDMDKETVPTLTDSLIKNTETITLLAVGDIMLSRAVGSYLKRKEHSLYLTGESKQFMDTIHDSYCLQDSPCVRFVNLESLFSTNPNNSIEASFDFRADINNENILREIQRDQYMIVNLANNHTTDVSRSDIDMTYTMISDGPQRIAIGAGSEEFMKIPHILDIQNTRLCANGYSYDGGGLHNPIDMNGIVQDVQDMEEAYQCDVRIIALHWGREYIFAPTQNQRAIAHQLADQGVDIILGHHSHVPGYIERKNDTLIFYSLGNFIFDQNRGFRNTPSPAFDSIFDHTLQRRTVPTYIGLLPALKIHTYTFIDGRKETQVHVDYGDLHMAQFNMGRRTTQLDFGEMTFAHPRTRREILQEIWKVR